MRLTQREIDYVNSAVGRSGRLFYRSAPGARLVPYEPLNPAGSNRLPGLGYYAERVGGELKITGWAGATIRQEAGISRTTFVEGARIYGFPRGLTAARAEAIIYEREAYHAWRFSRGLAYEPVDEAAGELIAWMKVLGRPPPF
ncbi:MAG TPA: hypothetical protein VI999_04540 [Thermoplasmata archaeon]|nr:hypothetical protein [Thermoplasmata archaeon]